MTSRARLSGGARELGEGLVCRQTLRQVPGRLGIELGPLMAVSKGTHAQSPRLPTAAWLGWVSGGARERFEALIRLERLEELNDARHVLAIVRDIVVSHTARKETEHRPSDEARAMTIDAIGEGTHDDGQRRG